MTYRCWSAWKRRSIGRETILEQINPRDAWIEVKAPPEVSAEFSTRWSFLAGYPAPAWSVEVPDWPSYAGTAAAARPELKVWWNPDEEARSGAELQVLPLLLEKNRPVVVHNEKNVLIESVTIEKHRVEVRRGVVETRSCLVVRLRHEINRPIITRLELAEAEGAEHRLYAKAGKYTGLYWFADDKDGWRRHGCASSRSRRSSRKRNGAAMCCRCAI